MDNMDFEEESSKLSILFKIISVLAILIVILLSVYLIFFKDKPKEKPKKEEGTTIIVEPDKKEEKEEIKQEEEIDEEILNTDYDNLIETAKLIDSINTYSIYMEQVENNELFYLVNDETKSILVSGSNGYAVIPYIYNDESIELTEDKCGLSYNTWKNCDYYVFHINNVEYFVNKKDNFISLNSYSRINNYFLDPNIDNLYLSEYNDDTILTYNGVDIFDKDTKVGILNTKTGLEYTLPKFKYLVEIGKNKFAGIIDSNVGLYTKNGEEILKPNYDFIGYIKTDKDRYIVTIIDDEIRFFDENMKSKTFKPSENMRIEGLHYVYYQYFINDITKYDFNSEELFKYDGDIVGEKNIIIFNPGCGDYDEENNTYSNSKKSLIYVIEESGLKRLDPSLVTPNNDLCDNWF